uniref:Uncharacterized protein n=1 Tax=Rhizophora mucronata TaxID=61149 RepID=A0A2P2JCP1_RHIMU
MALRLPRIAGEFGLSKACFFLLIPFLSIINFV